MLAAQLRQTGFVWIRMNDIAVQQENTEPLIAGVNAMPAVALDPAAQPLRNPRHERFARARSLLTPKIEAYRRAFDHVDGDLSASEIHAMRGNASKLERNPKVADRIAYLARQDEDVLRAKRERLEEFLWLIHEANPADLWEMAEKEKTDADGEPVLDNAGNPVMTRYQRLKFMAEMPEDLQRTVQSIKYTESGRPQVERYSAMQANQELRKLLGIGAVSREMGDGELNRLSDAELIAELSRQANDLGIQVDLTYRIGHERFVAGENTSP